MYRLAFLLFCMPALTQGATPVTTAPLSDLLEAREYSAPATLVADNSPALSAQISARIEQIPVRVGERVAAGGTLLQLDCRLHQSRLGASRALLQQLQAQQAFARRQLQRARDLRRKKSVSEEGVEQRQSELDSLSAQVRAQQEQVRQAALEVEHCTITAPFNGVVSERLASIGDLASPGTPLLRLVQLDDLEVSAQLGESEAASLPQASRYWFDYQGSRNPLQLRQLLPVVDTRSRTREARLAIADTDIPAGASGRLLWQTGQSVLPANYLVRRDGILGVFYLNGGKAHFHPLPEAIEGQPAVIALPPTTPIILEGRYGLQTGDEVAPDDPATRKD